MTDPPEGRPLLLACSVFRAELVALAKERWPGIELRFESSMLHMHPRRLEKRLGAALAEVRAEAGARPVGLVYGDCCAGMTALGSQPGVARIRSLNCPAILLGREEYARLSRQGAFFVLPEWAGRWEEIFRGELGLDETTAPELMREMHSELLYLDTGVEPVPAEALEACSRFTGLPWEAKRVSLDRLAAEVEAALAALGAGKGP